MISGPEHNTIIKWIIDEISVNHEDYLLDVGCGEGEYGELGKLLKLYVGVDINRTPVFRGHTSRSLLLSDAAKLPFKNDVFDKLICLEVLEHIPDDELALEEMGRVLKKNGLAFISVPNVGARWGFNFAEFDKKLGHLRRYSYAVLARMADSAGMSVVTSKYFGHFSSLIEYLLVSLPLSLLYGRDSLSRNQKASKVSYVFKNSLFYLTYSLLSSVLSLILDFDRILMHSDPTGNGIYVVLKKTV